MEEGERVEVTCSSSGFPAPTITWRSRGQVSTCHLSPVTCHLSHVTCHLLQPQVHPEGNVLLLQSAKSEDAGDASGGLVILWKLLAMTNVAEALPMLLLMVTMFAQDSTSVWRRIQRGAAGGSWISP